MRRPAAMIGRGVVIAAFAAAVTVACAPPPPAEVTFAFVGDSPYGTVASAAYPSLVASIDADPDVAFVAHAGDIRGGDTDCSDAVIRRSFELFQQFDDAFWFTPGDNEWTDCHRLGGFLPTERLAFVRSLFFPDPGRTTGGAPMPVVSQAAGADTSRRAFVENTLFHRECATFGAVHVVGSRDGAEPWGSYRGDAPAGRPAGDQPDLRIAETTARRAAAVAWIDEIFDRATLAGSEAVFVMMQAEPVAGDPEYAAVRERLLARTAVFDGEVMLGHGDQHVFVLTPAYGGVANLTRLEVPGEAAATDRWLEVTVRCGADAGEVFEVETVLVAPPA